MAEQVFDGERMTVDAFVEWDDGTDTRYELVDGRVVAIPMRWPAQALLVAKLGAMIHAHTSPGFATYIGCGVCIAGDALNFRIPDISVAGRRERGQWLAAPLITCDVLMAPTATFDLDRKLAFYRSISSIEASLIVRADCRRATVWRRHGDRWSVQDMTGRGSLALPHLEDSVMLDEIYALLEPFAAGE